jgi:hypothetical protein
MPKEPEQQPKGLHFVQYSWLMTDIINISLQNHLSLINPHTAISSSSQLTKKKFSSKLKRWFLLSTEDPFKQCFLLFFRDYQQPAVIPSSSIITSLPYTITTNASTQPLPSFIRILTHPISNEIPLPFTSVQTSPQFSNSVQPSQEISSLPTLPNSSLPLTYIPLTNVTLNSPSIPGSISTMSYVDQVFSAAPLYEQSYIAPPEVNPVNASQSVPNTYQVEPFVSDRSQQQANPALAVSPVGVVLDSDELKPLMIDLSPPNEAPDPSMLDIFQDGAQAPEETHLEDVTGLQLFLTSVHIRVHLQLILQMLLKHHRKSLRLLQVLLI